MSDVCIRGLEMPKRGFVDVRIFADDGICTTTDGETPYYKEYHAIPVPDHGRLIDGDEFYKDINESILLTEGFKETFNLWFDIQETVIPSSEG